MDDSRLTKCSGTLVRRHSHTPDGPGSAVPAILGTSKRSATAVPRRNRKTKRSGTGVRERFNIRNCRILGVPGRFRVQRAEVPWEHRGDAGDAQVVSAE